MSEDWERVTIRQVTTGRDERWHVLEAGHLLADAATLEEAAGHVYARGYRDGHRAGERRGREQAQAEMRAVVG